MNLSILEKLGNRFTKDSEFISEIIQKLEIPEDAKILDIGTGWGVMSIILALHGFNVTTGEPQKWSEWEKYAELAGVLKNIQYQEIDAQNLAFTTESVDYIFLLGSLHHIPDKKKAFQEFIRVLKGNGHIVLFDYTDKRIEQIKKHVHHHPPEVKPKVFLDSLPVNYSEFIDDKNEVFCFIVEKN